MTKTFYGLTDAATGQTIYVNPDTIRYIQPAGVSRFDGDR